MHQRWISAEEWENCVEEPECSENFQDVYIHMDSFDEGEATSSSIDSGIGAVSKREGCNGVLRGASVHSPQAAG